MNSGLSREDCCDDRGSEERQALYGDVVDQENETDGQCGRGEDTLLDGSRVQAIQNDCCADVFPLESRIRKILFVLTKEFGCLNAIRHREIRHDTDNRGNDAFNQEDHFPAYY